MHTDKTTLQDLSFFHPGGGIFHLLDHTLSANGQQALRQMVQQPPATHAELVALQEVVAWWSRHPEFRTEKITNGTLVMLEKFFESADSVSAPPSGLMGYLTPALQKMFNRNEFTFIKFSIQQLADFYGGLRELTELAVREPALPEKLRRTLEEMAGQLEAPLIGQILQVKETTPHNDMARALYHARRSLKTTTHQLLGAFARLDAWQSLAKATQLHGWTFPELREPAAVCLKVKGLYHPLIARAVAYDLDLQQDKNLLLLTGANMSGKTTLLRALGVAALLAHIGCGVPARHLEISFLRGIVTNMHVEDNILKGESYFFAEVQRMKNTALQLQQQETHLVLMDELFKGTNVHDAYECTKAVVEGLAGRTDQLMVLSTHLHEIAAHFKDHPAMQFAYFVTDMAADGSFTFTYQLRPGVSTDRIGYRILKREGVLDLLHRR